MARLLKENFNKNIKKFADDYYDLLYDIDPYWFGDDNDAEDIDVNLELIKNHFKDLYDFVMENDVDTSSLWDMFFELENDYDYDFPDKDKLTSLTGIFSVINSCNKEDCANYLFHPLLYHNYGEELSVESTRKEMGDNYVNGLKKLLDTAKTCGIVNKDETLEKICKRTSDW